jgi:hypothetical protein
VSEGFRLRQLVEDDSNSTLTLRLALLWQPHVYVNYIVRCQRSDTAKRTKSKARNKTKKKRENEARNDLHKGNNGSDNNPNNINGGSTRGNKVKVEARGAACSSARPGDMFVQLKVCLSRSSSITVRIEYTGYIILIQFKFQVKCFNHLVFFYIICIYMNI